MENKQLRMTDCLFFDAKPFQRSRQEVASERQEHAFEA